MRQFTHDGCGNLAVSVHSNEPRFKPPSRVNPLPPLALRAPETLMHNLRALFLFCPQDLLKDHHAERSTLGIHLSLPSQVPPGVRPGQIRDLALGGPAYLSGQVELGDEIVAVDGVPVSDADSVSALVRGSDEIGTTCVVTLRRDTETFDAVLIRGSSTRVRAIQKIFQLIDITDAHIKTHTRWLLTRRCGRQKLPPA